MTTNTILYPDYENSILCIPNSLLSHYGAAAHCASHPRLDALLAQGFRNVVLMVFDGMGADMLAHTLPPGAFLRRHMDTTLTSVYPSTTTAAITTFESGLPPIVHGWLGWSCYFDALKQAVELFTNKTDEGKEAAPYNVADRHLHYAVIDDQIRAAAPEVEVYRVSPFSRTHYAATAAEVCTHVRTLCQAPGRKFVYAYHPRPDWDMHDHGSNAEPVKQLIKHIDDEISRLCVTLKDTLVLVTADHGMTDTKDVYLSDTPEIAECLALPPSIESRCLSLFVKEEYKATFADRFQDRFGADFLLWSKEEALNSGIFGTGTPHPQALAFMGDYIAPATGKIRIAKPNRPKFAAMHAGLRPEEMIVPLITAEC